MKAKDVSVSFEETGSAPEGWAEGTRSYEATVGFTASDKFWSETFEYHQGPGIKTPPKARDLLAALASDAMAGDQTFADFCADFGYDEDSRKAFATWEACKATAEKLQAVFGSHFEDFCATEWDA